MTELNGKRVLITGGAQGIGLEMALQFASRGAEIVIADLNEAKLAEAKAKVEESGAAAWAFPVDVTNPASIAATMPAWYSAAPSSAPHSTFISRPMR
jgi:NAD(P)-dependent dehydrogenase (short-subunit alcohol dehydrogenase family)